jgi:hypothetical protein
MTNTAILKFGVRDPRRNLPPRQSKRRKEAFFVGAFTRAYLSNFSSSGFGGQQFALSGFGIADFIWIAWSHEQNPDEGSAFSLENFDAKFPPWHLTAFEMKLYDWRRGLTQAFRYSHFSDASVLVLPPDVAKVAGASLQLFKDLNIGLWVFDKKTETIYRVFTPKTAAPRNPAAREKALQIIRQRLQLSKLFKQGKPL